MPFLEFDRFAFDTVEGVLVDRGQRVSLPPTEAALLEAILRSRGDVMTRADLLKRAWPGVHVSAETVTRQMSRLRLRLGDTGRSATIIATVPRRGYRLLTRVRQAKRPARAHVAVNADASLLPIAVLPLLAHSDDLVDFADGLSERLIERISSVPAVRVIGRASSLQFAGRDVVPADVVARSRAGSVMTGALRQDGDCLVVALELVAADSTRVWACREQVARERSHLLETRLVRRFAEWFSPAANAGAWRGQITSSAVAYEQLMAGTRLARNLVSLSQLEQALNCLSRAVQLDPSLAAAHLALADVHLKRRLFGATHEAAEAARRSLDVVLTLDPRCAPAMAMRGVLIEETDWDREGARTAVERASSLAEGNPVVHLWCAAFFDRRGRYDESLAHLDAGLAVDPLSMELLVGRLSSLCKAGRHAEVIRQVALMQPLMQGDVGVGVVAAVAAYSHAASGNRPTAVELSTRIVTSAMSDSTALSWAIAALARAGEDDAARAAIAVLENRRTSGYVPAYFLSMVYACVGERDRALDFFEKAADERSLHVLYAATAPGLDSIQHTPRFQAVLKRIGGVD